MNRTKAEGIVARLLSSAAGLRYGSVSVAVKVHDGRVTETIYSVTESTRETGTRRDPAPAVSLRIHGYPP